MTAYRSELIAVGATKVATLYVYEKHVNRFCGQHDIDLFDANGNALDSKMLLATARYHLRNIINRHETMKEFYNTVREVERRLNE